MTSHYLDLTVVPDPETTAAQLLGTLYGRLHQTLVQQRLENVGVSFPRHSTNPRALGKILRLHGSADGLAQLMDADWLKGVRDHIRIAGIAEVPAHAPHRVVQRRQFKTSVERLRQRRMRRHGETTEQAAKAIPDSAQHRPNLPFVHLRSRSTGQSFCLFIALGPLQAQATAGAFNSYGLGGPTTVPWF